MERLQKTLAKAGLGSRRASEELIRQGRVTVDGQVVTALGTKVNPKAQSIVVDGRPIRLPESHRYYVMNKPAGYVTTASDPQGRPTVMELLRTAMAEAFESGRRVYPVGRLDLDSEGLLALTDDGDLAFAMTHPRYELEKEYLVNVLGHPTPAELSALRAGVSIDAVKTRPAVISLAEGPGPPASRKAQRPSDTSWLKVAIKEGRKRQVRRMCDAVGHPVLRLIRTRTGPLHLGSLAPGAVRRLTPREVAELTRELGLSGEDTCKNQPRSP